MTIRLIILIIVVFLVFRVIKRIRHAAASVAARRGDTSMAKLVRCDYCGVHFPVEDALRSNQRLYCCDEHKKRAET